jgi:hypothetical protein
MKRTIIRGNPRREENMGRALLETTVELTSLLLFVAMVGLWALGFAG